MNEAWLCNLQLSQTVSAGLFYVVFEKIDHLLLYYFIISLYKKQRKIWNLISLLNILSLTRISNLIIIFQARLGKYFIWEELMQLRRHVLRTTEHNIFKHIHHRCTFSIILKNFIPTFIKQPLPRRDATVFHTAATAAAIVFFFKYFLIYQLLLCHTSHSHHIPLGNFFVTFLSQYHHPFNYYGHWWRNAHKRLSVSPDFFIWQICLPMSANDLIWEQIV